MSENDPVDAANAQALSRLTAATPVWTDVRPALDVLPHMTPATILHAGPPIAWADMCGPQRSGVVLAALHEGLAETDTQAEAMLLDGHIRLAPCHEHGAVGGMAGITSASSPVAVVEDCVNGTRGYSQLFQGPAAGLQDRSAYGAEARKRWRWLSDVLGPVLGHAIRAKGGMAVKPVIAAALQMGDECHNRNSAGSALILSRLLLPLHETCTNAEHLAQTLAYLRENEQFSLVLTMAAGKAMGDAIADIPGCSLVSAMCRNGVDFGIRVSGTGGQWFTAPANRVAGLYFSSDWTDADAVPDLGDSSITETIGLGGHAQAAAPVLQGFVNGSFARAAATVGQMQDISAGRWPDFKIPTLDFIGAPLGIDIRKVVATGVTPVIDTAIAHRQGGVIGAGQTTAPLACFEQALQAFTTISQPER